jgi:hypothetical protein
MAFGSLSGPGGPGARPLAAPSLNKGEGLRVVCIRETLRDLKESAKFLIEDQLQEFDDLQDSR